ncbi:MAG: hypothetical protein IPO40_11525 [Fibrobacteres bacterium]|nr:hypothetical protein [Fibrobacterota bacterium]
MDLHQAQCVLKLDVEAGLSQPGCFLGWEPNSASPPGAMHVEVNLAAGKWQEFPVAPWDQVLLWVEAGMCLSNPDGEEPDVPEGFACVYRVRNRPSAVFLVAGPEGCRGKLVLVPGEI